MNLISQLPIDLDKEVQMSDYQKFLTQILGPDFKAKHGLLNHSQLQNIEMGSLTQLLLSQGLQGLSH